MNLIMSMSFAGTVILIVYILLSPLFSKIFSARQKYNIMIMALVFYLIPIQIGKKYFVNIFNLGGAEQQGKIFFNIPGKIIQITERREFFYPLSSTALLK